MASQCNQISQGGPSVGPSGAVPLERGGYECTQTSQGGPSVGPSGAAQEESGGYEHSKTSQGGPLVGPGGAVQEQRRRSVLDESQTSFPQEVESDHDILELQMPEMDILACPAVEGPEGMVAHTSKEQADMEADGATPVHVVQHPKLNPKSQADLDARACIPGAVSSKGTFAEMFAKYNTAYSKLSKANHSAPVGYVKDILLDHRLAKDPVQELKPNWPEWKVTLGVAALHLYNKRLIDLIERDNVVLLWTTCGDRLLRVHKGQVWCTNKPMDTGEFTRLCYHHTYLSTCVKSSPSLKGCFAASKEKLNEKITLCSRRWTK